MPSTAGTGPLLFYEGPGYMFRRVHFFITTCHTVIIWYALYPEDKDAGRSS